jgi:glycosyltransferase involved in cell wall biosynthesis
MPEHVSPEWIEFASKNTEYAIKKADVIVTVSEFSKREIMNVYKVSDNRIRVIYNGVGEEYFPRTQGIDEVKIKHGIRGKYILFVGAIEPRKNLLALIRAYNDLRQIIREEYRLVVIGVKRYGSEEILKKIEPLRLGSDIIFTGVVSREDLPLLYSGAELFVFPSIYEGFGMPVIEAMACGTPVIASNLTSIPEVAGDAALLIDPRDAGEIAEAIEAVLSDNTLKGRLSHKGKERARLFSWERNARETMALYKEVS